MAIPARLFDSLDSGDSRNNYLSTIWAASAEIGARVEALAKAHNQSSDVCAEQTWLGCSLLSDAGLWHTDPFQETIVDISYPAIYAHAAHSLHSPTNRQREHTNHSRDRVSQRIQYHQAVLKGSICPGASDLTRSESCLNRRGNLRLRGFVRDTRW